MLNTIERVGVVRGLDFSPDGKLLATASFNGFVKLFDAQKQSQIAVHPVRGHGFSVRFSPDGATLAVAAGETVQLWDPVTAEVLKELGGHHRETRIGHFSPDGRWLSSTGDDGLIRIWDLASEPDGLPTRLMLATFADMDINRDGTLLSVATTQDLFRGDQTNKILCLWSLSENRLLRQMEGHTDKLTSTAFAPNGLQVATGSFDRTVRIWDLRTGETTRILTGHQAAVLGIAYSPDGTNIASASEDKTIQVWNSETGDKVRTLKGHSSPVTRVAFTSDGNQLISASEDGQMRVWPMRSEAEPIVLSGHTDAIRVVALSNNPMRFASAGLDQQILVWDLETVMRERDMSRPTMRVFAQRSRSFSE